MSSSIQHAVTQDSVGKLLVIELVSSRYDGVTASRRPASWDERREGIDQVRLFDGSVLKLASSPMQSPPKPGWVIVLTGGTAVEGFTWTLYGISPTH